MITAVPNVEVNSSRIGDAFVKSILTDGFLIHCPSEGASPIKAQRAAGCLLTPEKDDLVLVAYLADNTTYILCVLERNGDSPANIGVEGDLRLHLPDGQLDISAKNGISLRTMAEFRTIAKELNFSAEQSRMIIGKLLVYGNSVKAKWDKAKVNADKMDSVVGRAVQIFTSRFTRIEALERLKAKVVHHEAEDLYAVRSKFTTVTAKKDVKIDGKQILVG
jgi:hypothetical protein